MISKLESRPTLTAALELACHGWPILPVDRCSGRPLAKAASSSTEALEFWRRWPDANLALPCGPETSVIALTIEQSNRGAGLENLKYLEDRFGLLPITSSVRTPNGGRALLFAHPADSLRIKVGVLNLPEPDGKLSEYAGLTIRGAGSSLYLPPSIGPAGVYRWDNHLLKFGIAALPVWLLGSVLSQPIKGARNRTEPSCVFMTQQRIAALLGNECRRLASIENTHARQRALYPLATRFGQAIGMGEIDQDTSQRILIIAAADSGLIESSGLEAVMEEIVSGLHAGNRNPRPLR